MCKVNRREFLATGTAFLSVAAEAELLGGRALPAMAEAAEADQVGPGVNFHEGQYRGRRCRRVQQRMDRL